VPDLTVEFQPRYDAQDIRSRVDLRAIHSFATGLSANGHEIVTRGQRSVVVECVFHDDSSPSLHLFYEQPDPHYHCFVCGAHGDCFTYVQQSFSLSFKEALAWIVERNLAGYVPEISAMPVLPPPKSTGTSDGKRLKLTNKRTEEYLYRDADGTVVSKLVVIRGETEDGATRKLPSRRHPDPHVNGPCKHCEAFWDLRPDKPDSWRNHHPNGWGYGDNLDRQIPYRYDRLTVASPDDTWIWPEGEKCVEAHVELGIEASTNPNGCAFRFPDWWVEPLKRPAGWIIVPDADAPGRIAGLRRYAWMKRNGLRVSYADLFPDRWDGYDSADLLAKGDVSYEQYRQLLTDASRVRLVEAIVTADVDAPVRENDRLWVPATREGMTHALAHPLSKLFVQRDITSLVWQAQKTLEERGALARLETIPPLAM
jgi:hypothetical protein